MKKYLIKNQKIIFLCILFIIGIASLFLFVSCDDSDSLYKVNIAENQNCTISTNKSEYYKDEQVMVYVNALEGFEIEETYYLKNDNNTKYFFTNSFTMPDGDVTIYAETKMHFDISVNDDNLGEAYINDINEISITPRDNAVFVGIKDMDINEYVYLNLADTYYVTLLKDINTKTNLGKYYYFNIEKIDKLTFRDLFGYLLSVDLYKIEDMFESEISYNANLEYYTYARKYVKELQNGYFDPALTKGGNYEVIFNSKEDTSTLIKEDIEYLVYNTANVAFVTGYLGNDTTLEIPDVVDENKVVGILPNYDKELNVTESTFSSSLQSITIPSSIQDIHPYTFMGLSNLTEVIAPNVTRIGEGAFIETNLQNIQVSEEVAFIDEYAFSGCQVHSIIIKNIPLINSIKDNNSLGELVGQVEEIFMPTAKNSYLINSYIYSFDEVRNLYVFRPIEIITNIDIGEIKITAVIPNSYWKLEMSLPSDYLAYWEYSEDGLSRYGVDDFIYRDKLIDIMDPKIYIYFYIGEQI